MLEVSKPHACKIIKQMNNELREKGFITIPGKVGRRYLVEKFYGMGEIFMPVYKDDETEKWYASCWYSD